MKFQVLKKLVGKVKIKMTKDKRDMKLSCKPNNYPVGDFLIKVKNAASINRKEVSYRCDKLVYDIAKKLEGLGFLESVERSGGDLRIKLSYHKKQPVIMSIQLISRPGLRVYLSAKDLDQKKGPSVYIVTTNKGILSHKEAVKQNVGGEVIAEIL